MGCGPSSIEKEAAEKSKHIDEELKADKEKEQNVVKLILLGAGGGGKSTIVKQLRIIHEAGYSQEDCKRYRHVVFSNSIESLVDIISAMRKLQINFADSLRHQDAKDFFDIIGKSSDGQLTSDLGKLMERLWRDTGVQLCDSQSRKYQLNDSAGYYLNDLRRLASPHYIPTIQDVLQTRVRSTGIAQTQFTYKNLLFKVFDVAGHRSERKKWFHCFEGIFIYRNVFVIRKF